MKQVMHIVAEIGEWLWSMPAFYVLLGAGVIFTIATRFIPWVILTHGIQVVRGKYDDKNDPGAINHFQALSAALSATIGLGNIGGVALAIGVGGPGALFWMWVVGFTGMALKTIEITLSMMYRDTSDPQDPHGGAMWVVEKVIGGKGGIWKPIGRAIGIFFCLTLLISTMTGGNMYQSWNVAALSEVYFGVPRIATGIIMAVVVGLVIVGGIKRIGHVAGRIVPVMCVLYVLSCLAVLTMHVAEIPSLLMLIVRSAFEPTQAAGAFIGGTAGMAFTHGLRRAMFSNEAGQGSAPIAHAAAKTDEPAREGIVGGLGPFIDTICICTLTALVILATQTWNRPAVGDFGGEIVLTPAANAPAGTRVWNVSAPDAMEMLPSLGDNENWGQGDNSFYLIGRLEGAHFTDTGDDRIKISAEIVPLVPEGTPARDVQTRTFKVKWSDVTVKLDQWDAAAATAPLTLTEKGLWRDYKSATLTGHAFDRQFSGLGKWLVTPAAWLFAISTMISWSYYGEQGVIYIFGRLFVLPYKVLFLILAMAAPVAIQSTADLLAVMDLGTGAMLWSNMPIVIGLGYLAIRNINDYQRRWRAGEFKGHAYPAFDDVMDGKDG